MLIHDVHDAVLLMLPATFFSSSPVLLCFRIRKPLNEKNRNQNVNTGTQCNKVFGGGGMEGRTYFAYHTYTSDRIRAYGSGVYGWRRLDVISSPITHRIGLKKLQVTVSIFTTAIPVKNSQAAATGLLYTAHCSDLVRGEPAIIVISPYTKSWMIFSYRHTIFFFNIKSL